MNRLILGSALLSLYGAVDLHAAQPAPSAILSDADFKKSTDALRADLKLYADAESELSQAKKTRDAAQASLDSTMAGDEKYAANKKALDDAMIAVEEKKKLIDDKMKKEKILAGVTSDENVYGTRFGGVLQRISVGARFFESL